MIPLRPQNLTELEQNFASQFYAENLAQDAIAQAQTYTDSIIESRPYFRNIKFVALIDNPFIHSIGFATVSYAGYILEMKGGCHSGNRGFSIFNLEKYIHRNQNNLPFSITNVSEVYSGNSVQGHIILSTSGNILTITIQPSATFPGRMDGAFSLMISGGGFPFSQGFTEI